MSRPQPPPRPVSKRAATTTSPVTSARVTSVGWEVTETPRLVAWVKFTRDEESWALRFEVLPTMEVLSLDPRSGGSAVQLAARGTVERYIAEHLPSIEQLQKHPPTDSPG
jgi:hypothetical protein